MLEYRISKVQGTNRLLNWGFSWDCIQLLVKQHHRRDSVKTGKLSCLSSAGWLVVGAGVVGLPASFFPLLTVFFFRGGGGGGGGSFLRLRFLSLLLSSPSTLSQQRTSVKILRGKK